ncbi:hypothetical protein BUALT_Bualt04G0172500 [Buddleja alternifolia]|uniref:Phytocyanin domain-containing protein n=1 Tax=Buddleja alternifolia TaxID=168488 RepID=A0AAV6Y105_9LAMI|nr:hypothetical protein BUALT_Bualt04G0172500 [Buddleja alternifolia]
MKTSSCRIWQLVVLILVSVIHKEALAAKHAVGGSQGWDESTNFDSWSSSETFKVGDELEFKYTPLHSVVELPNESAFKSCDIGSPLKSLSGGSNTVKLDKPGTRYFACGTSGHCEQGMKVKITTVAADGSSASSASSPATTTTTPSSSQSTSVASHQHQLLSFLSLITTLLVSLVFFI